MVRWLRICLLVSLWGGAALVPAGACGPFFYENSELDRFSLLEPGILNSQEWVRFLAFASPDYGQTNGSDQTPVQYVIHPERPSDTAPDDVDNLLYEDNPGSDAVTVAANEAWWTEYFRTERHRTVAEDELKKVLYGPDRPAWLAAPDAEYLGLLDGPSDSAPGLTTALAEAHNSHLPLGLRHRFAFWAVRALTLTHDPRALSVFRELCPGSAPDLPLARAQGWAASALEPTDPQGALALWTDLLVHWPDLRAQTFSSLLTLPASVWSQATTPGALVARFFVTGRDFSPETLRALAEAEQRTGTAGHWTEAVFYAMAEQIEAEAGLFALFNLVDPSEVPPSGVFTGLLDEAQGLVDRKVVTPTRTWWLIAAYVSLFDGDPTRAASFLDRARTLPATNEYQQHQADLIGALIQMDAEKTKDWSVALQNQVLDALAWGKTLNAVDHNRGLYHSVLVLAAQKELARGHNPQAAMAFGLVQGGPYRVASDDSFWTQASPSNNSINLFVDALMSDDDLQTWKAMLHAPGLDPLTAHLVARSFLSDQDLTWVQAHRALRRGEGAAALALLKAHGPATPAIADADELFSPRKFSYSLDLDPLDPGAGRGMRSVGPQALAGVMERIEADAKKHPTSRSLLAQGEFWFSLQLSGLPLLFGQPPALISFTNGNFEYYGYDGNDTTHDTSIVGDFPLGRPAQTDSWARRLRDFYRNEFSTLGRARAAFEAVVARHEDPESEFKALLFLKALGEDQYKALADHRYDAVPLADTFRTTCEEFRSRST